MTVSFFVEETLSDLTAWFIRCWDGNIRDAETYPYKDDNVARVAMKTLLSEHNVLCQHCSEDKPAALEVTSKIDSGEDIDISDNETQAIFDVLALPAKTTAQKIYGYTEGKSLQGRIILALALIDEKGERFSPHMSNRKLLIVLHQLYDLTVIAIKYDREVVWLEYP